MTNYEGENRKMSNCSVKAKEEIDAMMKRFAKEAHEEVLNMGSEELNIAYKEAILMLNSWREQRKYFT